MEEKEKMQPEVAKLKEENAALKKELETTRGWFAEERKRFEGLKELLKGLSNALN